MDDALFKALFDFSARMAASNDLLAHQKAGKQLQKDLARLKIRNIPAKAQGASRTTQRPTDT